MMVKGYVTNNTGRSRHIFKRTVYPGQKVPLDVVYSALKKKVPDGASFVDWLEHYLPSGWELQVTQAKEKTSTEQEEVEDAVQKDTDGSEDDGRPSMEYATPRVIDKMTARDIYNLRIKDNPRRILKNVTSIHKLRRALTLCKNDSRKATLIRLIQGRIRELNVTL